ncbi:low-density lipoprotein receptor-related protein 4-like [Ruditapes philippinarum]|uniref:low-density lipoprotein receptor-related protein 4-like n=1 Tax=Ruditapes philippinarum TaxID=129788 RepID=UPI00295A7BE2|nr:low-density lipoprotein receptor-related protein 4-like [Ruditapes philippinarum]
MRTKMVFYTNDSTIFKQPAFKEDQREVLYESAGIIIDMDVDWISGLLYWIEKDNGHLYYVHESGPEVFDEQLTDSDITNIAVDPHNKKVYWISSVLEGTENKYVLSAWSMKTKTTEIIPTLLLSKPSDLEYDRLKDRLLWNDNDGHIGMINTDGTGERKYDTATTGEPRHAVTVYKNFIISSTGENRQFDIVYELDKQRLSVNLHKGYDGFVEDVHVYEKALQPFDLESCEVNNGDCEHVCRKGSERKCACFLGYVLNDDNKSCRSAVLNEKYFVVLDAVHKALYQVDQETKAIHTITIRQDNVPVGLAFDPKRKGVIWVDKKTNSVKKITLGSSDETAVMSGVDNNADIAVDVSSGNIYISSGRNISVIRHSFHLLTIVDSTNIIANIGKIAVMPQSG